MIPSDAVQRARAAWRSGCMCPQRDDHVPELPQAHHARPCPRRRRNRETLAQEPGKALREGLASLLMALPCRPRNRSLFKPLLQDDDPVVVAAAAHTLAGRPETVCELDPDLVGALRRHTKSPDKTGGGGTR